MTFPVQISGRTYESAEELAGELRRRARHRVLDHPGQSFPVEHFATDSARRDDARRALSRAALLMVPLASTADELHMLLHLPVDYDDELREAWLERWVSGGLPWDHEPALARQLGYQLLPVRPVAGEPDPRLQAMIAETRDLELELAYARRVGDSALIVRSLAALQQDGRLRSADIAVAVGALGPDSERLYEVAALLAGAPRPLRDKLRNTVRTSYPDWYAEHGVELRRLMKGGAPCRPRS